MDHVVPRSRTPKVLNKHGKVSPGAAKGTKREVTVETKIIYITEVGQTWKKSWNDKSFKKVTYKYVLELGRFGRIIGGRWLSYKRPDFIWKESLPYFQGILTGLDQLIKKSR